MTQRDQAAAARCGVTSYKTQAASPLGHRLVRHRRCLTAVSRYYLLARYREILHARHAGTPRAPFCEVYITAQGGNLVTNNLDNWEHRSAAAGRAERRDRRCVLFPPLHWSQQEASRCGYIIVMRRGLGRWMCALCLQLMLLQSRKSIGKLKLFSNWDYE